MNRQVIKYVVRVALFASALAAIACSNPTAPAAVNAKKPSLKDLGDSTLCRSGYTVVNGLVVCNDGK
jgi:hypothetical protein